MSNETKMISMTEQVLSGTTDKQFLRWIHQRLQHHHGENPWYDYMHKLRCIIDRVPEDQVTPNVSNDYVY